ncbi:MAG: hypothetical protein D6674_02640 [Acidobacteria bacterium]|jgi:hypothetical protein|nr:MAG: hypothetical protein D6674_02640 [Acidobacteriota bacterium]
MSYYRELRQLVLELKGGEFFLSPRDRWFLKFLEENNYPLPVVKEGIRRFFLKHPPERRRLPLFMSFGEIEKLRKVYRKGEAKGFSWQERFWDKVKVAERFLGELKLKEPEDMESAEGTLQMLENTLAKKLWDNLPKEEKLRLRRKFSQFATEEELFKLMIKRELLKREGLGRLSVFVD